jgi:hypothetical protein
MYTALSSLDFSATFLVVHAVGAERIEPYFQVIMHRYRVIRHGEEGAAGLEREITREKDEARRKEEEEMAGLSEEERRKRKSTNWGSKALLAEVALAYAIHKTALLPFRAGLTVAWTPKLVNWLTRRGWVGKVSEVILPDVFAIVVVSDVGGR